MRNSQKLLIKDQYNAELTYWELTEKTNSGYIFDRKIRFEIKKSQTQDVNKVKQKIYDQTKFFFQEQYKIYQIDTHMDF